MHPRHRKLAQGLVAKGKRAQTEVKDGVFNCMERRVRPSYNIPSSFQLGFKFFVSDTPPEADLALV